MIYGRVKNSNLQKKHFVYKSSIFNLFTFFSRLLQCNFNFMNILLSKLKKLLFQI